MSDRLAQLTRMLEREPGDAFCLYGLAQEYAKQGDLATAIVYYDRAIAADPSHGYSYFHKARCEEERGSVDAAKQTLQRGLEQAIAAHDAKATHEIRAYLDELA